VACSGEFRLVAGTAWLFARPEFDQPLDYRFVHEAGQVSLANLVAMGVSAKNIVLVGDQMQLAQPIQGTHPGGSGVSAMEHLLGDHATVSADRGIFLAETRRMHPDVCRFISDAVYDGRLHSEPKTERQRLVLDPAVDPEALSATGLRFVCVEHDGCAQKSAPEAERLKRTYEALIGQQWVNEDGVEGSLGIADILVVSPYNMQVNLLESVLPSGARGHCRQVPGPGSGRCLDLDGDLLGRAPPAQHRIPLQPQSDQRRYQPGTLPGRDFASPRLLEIPCATIAQMQLVNTLCWAKDYSEELARRVG
jgi:hypothetical protein